WYWPPVGTISLRLVAGACRIALLLPHAQALVEHRHLGEARLDQLPRELAGLGMRAGAIADEPRVLRQLLDVGRGVIEGDAHGPGDVLGRVVGRRARVEQR